MKSDTVFYTERFIRNFKRLPRSLQEKVAEKEDIFKKNPYEPSLKTHKLKGELKGKCSFSVDYRYRIVFAIRRDQSVAFIDIGTHEVYK